RGANVNRKGFIKDTPLMLAIKKNRPEVAKLLLNYGAYVNVKDMDGRTALMHASFYGNIVRLLLAYGADVNASDKDGETALTKAYDKWDFFSRVPKEDYNGTIKALLGAGATE
ncbi:MAG: ankyrin repeat domain-containing protein, partial [Bdellovibrionales bacterium]